MIVRRSRGHHSLVMHARPPADGQALEFPEDVDARVAALVAEHLDFIWRLLRRQGLAAPDADDAVQQVFLIASQKLDRMSPGHERPFLYGVALRVASNARRSARRRREDADAEIDSRHATAAPIDQRAELARAWALLDELLAEMPAELARVLALAEIEQLEVPEIAALEEIPVGTAASRLRRARERFRGLLRTVAHRNPFTDEER